MARDHFKHPSDTAGREQHRPGGDADRLELLLDDAPDRLLVGRRPVLTRLVLGIDGRQPDNPRAAARGNLHRLRVQPADAGVQRNRAEHIDARGRSANDGSPLGGREVVRLEHEAGKPELGEAPGEREVVDPPRREIGLDVDVQVIRAANELAPARGRLSARSLQGAPPPRAREAFL